MRIKTLSLAVLMFGMINCAWATMDASWGNEAPEQDILKNNAAQCPEFVMIKNKTGELEEYTYSHYVEREKSSVKAGECVYY